MDSDSTPPLRKVVPAPPQDELGPDEAWFEVHGVILPVVSPDLRACFDRFDAMTKGMSSQEMLAILPDLYFDAEGVMRIRRQQIRAVPDLD